MNLLPTDGYLVPTKWSFKAGNQIRPVPIFIDMFRVIRMSLCIKVFHYIPANISHRSNQFYIKTHMHVLHINKELYSSIHVLRNVKINSCCYIIAHIIFVNNLCEAQLVLLLSNIRCNQFSEIKGEVVSSYETRFAIFKSTNANNRQV